MRVYWYYPSREETFARQIYIYSGRNRHVDIQKVHSLWDIHAHTLRVYIYIICWRIKVRREWRKHFSSPFLCYVWAEEEEWKLDIQYPPSLYMFKHNCSPERETLNSWASKDGEREYIWEEDEWKESQYLNPLPVKLEGNSSTLVKMFEELKWKFCSSL